MPILRIAQNRDKNTHLNLPKLRQLKMGAGSDAGPSNATRSAQFAPTPSSRRPLLPRLPLGRGLVVVVQWATAGSPAWLAASLVASASANATATFSSHTTSFLRMPCRICTASTARPMITTIIKNSVL